MLLIFAARYGHAECVSLLLRAGSKPGVADIAGRTPLHLASWFGHTEVARVLLNGGAQVDPLDFFGRTPLHYCCWFGNRSVELLLLERKTSVNATDHSQNTPLHFACTHSFVGIVGDLLRAGADTKVKNDLGRTPEQVAEMEDRGEILELLRQDKDAEQNLVGVDKNIVHEQRQINKMLDEMVQGQDKQSAMIQQLKGKLATQYGMLTNLRNQGLEMGKQLRSIEDVCRKITAAVDSIAPRELSGAQKRFDISRVSGSLL